MHLPLLDFYKAMLYQAKYIYILWFILYGESKQYFTYIGFILQKIHQGFSCSGLTGPSKAVTVIK